MIESTRRERGGSRLPKLRGVGCVSTRVVARALWTVPASLSATPPRVSLAACWAAEGGQNSDLGASSSRRNLSARPPQVNNASRYTRVVLGSFRDKDAERIWRRQRSRRLDSVRQRAALRKLLVMDAAEELDDLRVPPGNHLERLHGDLAGRYSIRINDQWRICFRWTTSGPEEVEIVDYH